jgi:hypothetical protein
VLIVKIELSTSSSSSSSSSSTELLVCWFSTVVDISLGNMQIVLILLSSNMRSSAWHVP